MKKNKLLITLSLMLIMMLSSFTTPVVNVTECKAISIETPKKSLNVFVTVYKYDKYSQPTADGSILKEGVSWCAVSPDIIKDHNLNFGDTIYYKNVGYAIHDLTHFRFKNRVDILIHNNEVFAESGSIYINTSNYGN